MVISGKNHILIKLKHASCVLYPNIRYIFVLQILGMMPLNLFNTCNRKVKF